MMDDVISDTFQPVRSSLDDTQSGYHDFVLLRETASARLYRVSKSGKHFIIKTPIDNSAMRLSMLKREYEMAISLNHHHLPHFFTYESHTPVGPGIVMEYIDGRNLNEYLAENPSLDSRRRVFYQLLDAVAYIHKNGIIHNDLKPENILISRANNDVKLIDFGLSDNDAHYMAKTLGCTPDYASPELLAQSDDIDARSDIYSLGRIMQRIFGHKFSRISHRCTSHDRNRRYDNVDQILRYWLKRQRNSHVILPLTITLFLILIVGAFFLGQTISESAQIINAARQNGLIDSLNIARAQTQAIQARFDSIVSIQAESERIQIHRQHIQDSLMNIIDTTIENTYLTIKKGLAQIPYYDFAAVYFGPKLNDAMSIYERIKKDALDNEMRMALYSYHQEKYTRIYNEIVYEAFSKPQLKDAEISEEEKDFYEKLLFNDQPYRPYTNSPNVY